MNNKKQLLEEFNLFLAECEIMGRGLLINNKEYLQGSEVFILYDKYKDRIKDITYNDQENNIEIEVTDNNTRIILNVM